MPLKQKQIGHVTLISDNGKTWTCLSFAPSDEGRRYAAGEIGYAQYQAESMVRQYDITAARRMLGRPVDAAA